MTNFVVSTEKCKYMPIDPVILITGIYPSKKIITHVQKKAECRRMLIAALFITVKKQKQPALPSIRKMAQLTMLYHIMEKQCSK